MSDVYVTVCSLCAYLHTFVTFERLKWSTTIRSAFGLSNLHIHLQDRDACETGGVHIEHSMIISEPESTTKRTVFEEILWIHNSEYSYRVFLGYDTVHSGRLLQESKKKLQSVYGILLILWKWQRHVPAKSLSPEYVVFW